MTATIASMRIARFAADSSELAKIIDCYRARLGPAVGLPAR
ncbi:hypothetical protein ACTMTI_05685 [Nonomuraea sp. H19]